MKALSLISLLVTGYVSAYSQSTAGITGVRDTSYNIINEYNKHLKNYPDIKVVTEVENSAVISKKDVSFCQTKERDLKLDLFYPRQKTVPRGTAIIFIHGGGWRS